MGMVWVFSDTGAKPVLLKRYRCLNRHLKKKSKKRQLTMTTLKISSAIFPVIAVHMAHCHKTDSTVALVASASYELALKHV